MKISSKIFTAFIIVLLLFTATTFINYRQSQEITENNMWLSNSQSIIRTAGRLQRNIIDMESDLRGFLLTGDNLFKNAYKGLDKENGQLYIELKGLISENSFQKNKLDSILILQEKWKTEIAIPLFSEDTINIIKSRNYYKTLSRSIIDKDIRNTIIQEFREFNNHEYDLRDTRKAILTASITKTRELSFSLTAASIFLGLMVAVYLTRVISKRIYKMANLADEIAKGNFEPIEDASNDELTSLSVSLNRMARTLSENIFQLEKRNAELDQFAYIVSHDLKAPLRGIQNVIDWIEEDLGSTLESKMKEFLAIIKGRLKRMEGLIEGILEYSRIGKGKRCIEHVNLNQLILEIIELLAPPPKFKIELPANLPVIKTEKIGLQQVISNLVSNAIKYNDKEKGWIKIDFQEEEQHYRFKISDNGPGISPKYHKKIFGIFQTLVEKDAFESTGIGLSIVKKVLDEEKSNIEVDSDEGRGASFSFSWPKIMDSSFVVI